MIRQVTLQNWRAYRAATIDLGYPMVFFVAPNGVGKSSLYEAARHCLLGFPSGRNAVSAIRSGSDSAQLSMVLTLAGETVVTVTRSLTRTGRTSFSALNDGAPISEASFYQLLERTWMADPALLDRLVFSDLESHARTKVSLPIRDHLAHLLGITPLLEAASSLKQAQASTAKAVAGLRSELAISDEEIAVAESAVTEAEEVLDRVERELNEVRSRLIDAETAAASSAAWEAYRTAVVAYNERVQVLLDELGAQISVDPAEPVAALDKARVDAERHIVTAHEAIRHADRTAGQAATAANLLAASPLTCPVCLRSLSDDERTSALRIHGDIAASAEIDTEAINADVRRTEQHLRVLNDFTRRLDRLRAPIAPAHDDPGPQATTELSALRSIERELAERLGEARARRRATAVMLDSARSDAAAAVKLKESARKELLLQTTAAVLEGVADRYLADQIEPLAQDVAHRWKLLFGSEGPVMGPGGEIQLRRGEMALDPDDMSGGERAIAGVIVRLLVVAAVTRIPTVWFDEPLEHLDPRRRAGVAQTLVKAVASGTVNQILVATYEEGIARRLALAAPDLVTVVHADADRDDPADIRP